MPTKEVSRNKLQEQSMSALYAVLTYLDMKENIDVEGIISGISDLPYAEAPIYTKEIVIETIKHMDEEVKLLNSHMNKWTFDRLNRAEQAILLLSLTHFFYLDDKVDKKVVINVAVVLAHTFLSGTDYKFVNAILDKVLVHGE
jgi:N utilization substance protein B